MNGQVLGVVLAGGRSSRFGSDKALALHDGKPLIEHAIERLSDHCNATAVSGRAWKGMPGLPDLPASRLGPLGGINAALRHAKATGHDWVLSIACDTPFVAGHVLARLVARRVPAYLADHPVIGMWPCHAAGLLDDWLGGPGKRSMRAFAAMVDARPIDAGSEIANFNYAGDLEEWRRRMGCAQDE